MPFASSLFGEVVLVWTRRCRTSESRAQIINYAYDAFDRLTYAAIGGSAATFHFNHGHGVGPATTWIHPTGMTASRTFDPQGRQVGRDVVDNIGMLVASYRESYGPDGIVRALETTLEPDAERGQPRLHPDL